MFNSIECLFIVEKTGVYINIHVPTSLYKNLDTKQRSCTEPFLKLNWDLPMFSSHLVYILEWTIFKNNTWLIKLIVLYFLQYFLLAFLGIATKVDSVRFLGIIPVLYIQLSKFTRSVTGLFSTRVFKTSICLSSGKSSALVISIHVQ